MAPKLWSEWSTTLSHLALGVVSLHAAVSTAQVSTLGGRQGCIPLQNCKDLDQIQFPGSGKGWWEAESGDQGCMRPPRPSLLRGKSWLPTPISPPIVVLTGKSRGRRWLPAPGLGLCHLAGPRAGHR